MRTQFTRHLGLALPIVLLSTASYADGKPGAEELAAAVRGGNIAKVKTLLGRGADPNSRDGEKTPVIMLAALYGNADMVRLLLDRGADPNAPNADEATALIWSAGDPAKVRALVSKGANVNAQSKQGRTPLHTAASQDGAFESVRILVDKGAGVNAVDRVPNFATAGVGSTPLMLAARGLDSRAVKYLLAHGAQVDAADSTGGTALFAAARQGSAENVKLLLEAGANPNITVGEMPFKGFTPLSWAAITERFETVSALIAGGANVNARDSLGYTPLTWAAMTERSDKRIVEALLKAGADPSVKGAFDETPATWAAKRGFTPVSALFGAQSAPVTIVPAVAGNETPDAAAIRNAVRRSIDVMLPSGPKFFKVSGCVSCHNNTLPVVAARVASERGVPVDQTNVEQQIKMMKAMAGPATEIMRQATDALPDVPVVGGYILDSLAAAKYAPDAMTTALVQNIVTKQLSDGSWPNFAPRPPIENGNIQATAFGIRALQLYAPAGRRAEINQRIASAREWLRHAEPKTAEELVMQLWGLHWAGARRAEVEAIGRSLLGHQRADGGWAQLESLETDAYATGKVMAALHDTGLLKASDVAYLRGVSFLMNTQREDGSWVVKSRAFPFQPLKESGFPHGRDQWISAAGTAWASIALSYALDGGAMHIAQAR